VLPSSRENPVYDDQLYQMGYEDAKAQQAKPTSGWLKDYMTENEVPMRLYDLFAASYEAGVIAGVLDKE
jgi:hypothetical protein